MIYKLKILRSCL